VRGQVNVTRALYKDTGTASETGSPWWRRRESKPEVSVTNGRETSRNVASDASRHDVLRRNATCVCETSDGRAAFIALLAGHIARFLASGDIDAVRIATDAITRLLGSPPNDRFT
jgi:hypothetical protein